MDASESPTASDSGTLGVSPSHPHLNLNPSRKRKHSQSVDRPIREYGLMRDTGRHDTARFVGSGSGIHFIRGVYLRLARKSAASRASNANALDNLVPGEDDQLHRGQSSNDGDQQNLWQPNEVAFSSSDDEPHPSFEQLVAWSNSYFKAWHPTMPFLSAPDVLALFEKLSEKGISCLSYLEQSVVRSILSVSLADSRQSRPFDRPLPPSLVFQTIDEAMSASQFALYQPASIKTTQAALGIQLFLISMLRLNAASRLGGLIVRMAFHIGLHRCPTRYPFFTKEQASIRRRVFWCIYSNERFLCQSLGLPLDIRDDDVDVCYPGEEHHSTSSEPDDSRLQLLTSLAKHARIRGLILELRNKSIDTRNDSPGHESHVQAELARWSNEIHDAVEEEPSETDGNHGDGTPSYLPAHRVFLLLLKYESMISLNRPMMATDPSSAPYRAGLQNCIFAARSLLFALKKHQSRHKIGSDPSDAALGEPLLWPSITWAVWISSFILIYAASEGQLPLPSALRHVEAGKEALRHILLRDTAWPGYSLSAIDELTATVRELSHPGPHTSWNAQSSATSGLPNGAGAVSGSGSGSGSDRRDPAKSDSDQRHTSSGARPMPDFRRQSSHSFSPTVAASTGVPEDQGTGASDASQQPHSDSATWHRTDPVGYSGRQPRPLSVQHPSSTHNVPGGNGSYANPNAPPMQPYAGPAAPGGATPFAPGQYSPPNEGGGGSNAQDRPALSADGMVGTMPGGEALLAEGQEPMVWYDQLFANSLGAIDYPFLAAAQFDSSVDPTWSYLR